MNLFQRTQDHADSEHPSIEQLNAYAVGQLSEHISSEVEQHLAVCALCNQQLESSPNDSFVALLQQGDSLLRDGPSSAVAPSRSLRFVPGYTLLELLGEGGMGVVWKARQDGLNRVVALKRLRSAGAPSPEALARFRREAESVARLGHANIVRIYEVGEQDGEPYLALEYVGGSSLARKLTTGPLLPAQAAALVETLARAMHHAHENGIVHRDLKPDNILLDDNGTPKISDFGLAKQFDEASAHTQTGTILGTPSYMAPEQAGGDKATVGPPADVYALGAILYETLTGRPPFRGPDVLDTLAQVRERDAVPPRQLQPNLPRDLQTICLKCLHKDPRRRYGSALALADDLRRFNAGEPIQARPVGLLERLLKWMRRKPTQAILAAFVFLIPLAAITALLWHNDRLRREIVRADTAERNTQDNYQKSRQTILSMLGRFQQWQSTGEKKTAEMGDGLLQDGLAYIETVLNNGDHADPQVRADAAELLSTIAVIQVSQGRRAEARTSFLKSFRLWEQLASDHPDVSIYRSHLANCYRIMGQFLSGDDRQKEAWLERAVTLQEEQCRLNPDDDLRRPLDLAQCLHDTAALLQLAGRLREAEEHYDRAVALMTKIRGKHPQHHNCKLALADSYGNLGQLYHFTGRIELAERTFARADALYEQLMHEEFSLTPPVTSRSSLAINWGNLYLQTGQIDKALASYDRGIAWSEGVLSKEPNDSNGREMAYKLHGSKANVYEARQRFAEAAAEWKRVVELTDGPARREYRMRWCASLARVGDSDRAAAEAAALAAEPGCAPDLLYNLACVFALSGRAEKAVALLKQLRSNNYFDKTDHRKTLLTDTDLDSLRKRDDFTKLTNGLANK